MSEQQQLESQTRKPGGDDEIHLVEHGRILLKYKRLILSVTLGAAVLAAGISMLLPNIYRAEVLIASASDDSKAGSLSSALGGLGGMATLAGISLGGGGDVEQNIAVLKSRDFLWQFVQEKKLMPILFADKWDEQNNKWKNDDPKKQPGQLDVHRLFIEDGALKVNLEKKTGLITISVEGKNAGLAAEWANDLVERLNQYLARQAIARSTNNLKYLNDELRRTQIEDMRKILFDLIASELKQAMLASTQKNFAFKVLDPAVEPDKEIKPHRLQIIGFAALIAGFVAGFVAFVRERRVRLWVRAA